MHVKGQSNFIKEKSEEDCPQVIKIQHESMVILKGRF